jgi:ribosomal protein L24
MYDKVHILAGSQTGKTGSLIKYLSNGKARIYVHTGAGTKTVELNQSNFVRKRRTGE